MERGTLVGGRFEVVRRASTGGMGEVYRAHDRLSGEVVALKVLDPRTGGIRGSREAELLAALHHPAIVRYVAHGVVAGGPPYLVTEWLEGCDLSELLAARRALSVSETVGLGRRVADALGLLHAERVVHRDVKPENLFLVAKDVLQVKLLDLGIARHESGRSFTRTGVAVGTPAYMAPEQARGSSTLDGRVDVFALGTVLYECLSGRPAFEAAGLIQLMAKVTLEELPPLAEIVDGVPVALSDLIARMTAKDRNDRPRSGSEVAALLADLGELPSGAVAPSRRAPSLTIEEKQLFCVLLGRPKAGRPAPDLDATLASTAVPLPVLEEISRASGAELLALADGSFVAALRGVEEGLAGQGTRAARLALAVAEALPGAALALATGWARTMHRLPVGEVAGRAAALLGEPGISLDEATASLLEARFEIARDQGRVRLLRERRAALAARTLLGKPTPCVGRDRELAMLEAFYEECVGEPRGRPVVITAEPGIGKSRLLHELLHRLAERERPPEVWLGSGDPVSAGSAFGLLSRAIRRAAALHEGEPIEERRKKLRAFIELRVPAEDLDRVTAFIGEMLGATFPDDSRVQLRAARGDARIMGDQMRRAFEELLAGACEKRPVLLALEDLHWGDMPSVAFVDSALRNLGERPCLVLAFGRPELQRLFPDLWVERDAQTVKLDPLGRRAARTLVRAVLDEVAEGDVERIIARSSGNAFALEELIRALAEGRGDELPDTVLEIADARIELLEPAERRILRAASVFGETFWAGGLRALAGEEDVDAWLGLLADQELITRRVESRFPGDQELTFRHGLVREAAYRMLTDADRVLGHRLAAGWLEERGETDALEIAEHWEAGGEGERAAASYLRATRQALDGDDLDAAIARAERGCACGARGDTRSELLLAAAEAHRWRAEPVATARHAAEALDLLPRGGARWLDAMGELAWSRGVLGEVDALTVIGEELVALEPAASERSAFTRSCVIAAERLAVAGRVLLAESLVGRAEEVGATLAGREPEIAARLGSVRSWQAILAGDPAVALEHLLRSIALYEQAGDRRTACRSRHRAGFTLVELGAHARAEAVLREALAAARQLGLRKEKAVVLNNLGRALARQGRLREAHTAEQTAIELAVAQQDRRLEGGSRCYLAEVLLLLGEPVAARAEAERAAALLEPTPPLRPLALGILARIELDRGDVVAARAAAGRARALLDDLGELEEGDALVRLVDAETLDAAGETDRAQAALADGYRRLLLRARRIADPELRRSFLAAVPEHARTLKLASAWGLAGPALE